VYLMLLYIAIPQLSPAFGRGGGGGGGFFEGTMDICSASSWLNNSSSGDDGEDGNRQSSGELSKGFPRCATDRSIPADAGTIPFG